MRICSTLLAILLALFCVNSQASDNAGSGAVADVRVTLRAYGEPAAPPGPYVGIEVLVRNHGPNVAANVVLEIATRPNTVFHAIHGGSACTTPEVGNAGTIRCAYASLGVNGAAAPFVRLRVLPPAIGTIFPVTATVRSDSVDPNATNNSATMNVLPQGLDARSDRAISVIASPEPVPPGGTLNYHVTLINHGPDPSNGVAFQILHPIGLGLEFVDIPAGWVCAFDPIGVPPPLVTTSCRGEFPFEVGGATLRLRVQVPADAIQAVTLTFFLNAFGTTDPQPANNSVTVTTRIGVGEGAPVPALSPALLAVLALLLAALGSRAALASK